MNASEGLEFAQTQVARASLDHCVKCTICETHCPVAAVTPKFTGPKFVGPQAERFRHGESVDHSLDYCSSCGACTLACPQGVKIAELNKPITKLDAQGIIDELKNRPDEDRDILLIGSGVEMGVELLLAERQQLVGSINKIEVKDIQTDGVIVAEPAEADVSIDKQGDKVAIKINSYISPTIIKRLDLDRSIFGEHIRDFRAQIDTIMIDTDYDGKTFNVIHSDVPAKKSDFVAGEYELDLPKASKKVAVKITDMLGEETIILADIVK